MLVHSLSCDPLGGIAFLHQTFQPSRFDRETHGLGCQFTALPLNLTVNQRALKLPNNSGRYYLTHIFDVSRFEVLISRFIWAFFSKPADLDVMGVGRSVT